MEEHLVNVLCNQSVKEELRYYLENNIFVDDNGEEIEFLENEFDWSISLNLKFAD